LEIRGLNFFSKHLMGALENFHAQRPDPKRKLHYDQYLCMLLLAYFNPTLSSLRALQAASGIPSVQKKLHLSYASLGSLSEASRVFDPELARKLFQDLAGQAQTVNREALPSACPNLLHLVAADATLWDTLPRMAQELYREPLSRRRKGGIKGHFQFNVLAGVPVDAVFTPGAVDERQVLPQRLLPGVLYVLERGYHSFELYAAIQAAGSSLLARLREDNVYQVLEQRPVSPQAQKVGVYFDALVKLGRDPDPTAPPLRVLKARVVSPAPHNLHPRRKCGKHKAYDRSAPLVQEWVLVTDRLDLDADLLLLLYRYRWKVELFFRWLKCTLNCQHLFCESENGLKIQFYAALIASLLVVLYTGRKPNKRIWEVLQLYFSGWAEWTDVEMYIAKYGKPALP
jgi:hypothetical protein